MTEKVCGNTCTISWSGTSIGGKCEIISRCLSRKLDARQVKVDTKHNSLSGNADNCTDWQISDRTMCSYFEHNLDDYIYVNTSTPTFRQLSIPNLWTHLATSISCAHVSPEPVHQPQPNRDTPTSARTPEGESKYATGAQHNQQKLCGFKGVVRMINPGSICKTLWR